MVRDRFVASLRRSEVLPASYHLSAYLSATLAALAACTGIIAHASGAHLAACIIMLTLRHDDAQRGRKVT